MANVDRSIPNENNLTQRVVRGAFWLFSLRAGARVVSFASYLILARILAPLDFGVLGMAMLVIAFLETLSQSGFNSALIQKKEKIDDFLDTAWTVSIIRGAVLCIALFLSAPIVAAFFNNPKSGEILRLLALAPLANGLTNIGIVFFRKELHFKKVFVYKISGAFTNAIIGVSLAIILRNVWALAYAYVAGRLAMLLMSYVLHPYRPRLHFDFRKAKDLFNFGKWLLMSNIISYFVNQGDNAFVGKVLGATFLGYYALGYKIANLPCTEITRVVSHVMFPVYSKVQDDPQRLREAYSKMLQIIVFFSMPLAGLIFVLSHDFTMMFLGMKWLPMVPILQIFCFSALLRSVSSTTGTLFQGVGQPHIVTKLVLIRLFIIAALIYPFTSMWKAQGTALSVLISAAVVDPFAVYLAIRISKNSIKEISKILVIPIVNTALTVSLLFFAKTYLVDNYGILTFFILLFVGSLLYIFAGYLCQVLFKYQMLIIVKDSIHGLVLKKAF